MLEIVMTAVGSFRIDEYLEERIYGDYMIGNANWTVAAPRELDFRIDEAYAQGADTWQGVSGKSELWTLNSEHILSEKGQKQFQKLDKEGKLEEGLYYKARAEDREKMGRGELALDERRYAYSEDMLENLKPVKGEIDAEKFRSGKYVLLEQMTFLENAEVGDSCYEPGDKIILQTPTKDTEQEMVYDENQELIGTFLTQSGKKGIRSYGSGGKYSYQHEHTLFFNKQHYNHSSFRRNQTKPGSDHVCQILYRRAGVCREL